MHSTGQTAILIFSRDAEEEIQYKRFTQAAGKKAELLIARALIRHTQAVTARLQVPVFRIGTAQQRGDDFGKRLAHAFLDNFNLGFEKVIALDNNCPALEPGLLTQAIHTLSRTDAVLGPNADGVAYLIGLTKTVFEPNAFARLRQQAGLYACLCSWIQEPAYDVEQLTLQPDIDHAKDIKKLLPFRHVKNLCNLLASISSIMASQHTAGSFILLYEPPIACPSPSPARPSFPGLIPGFLIDFSDMSAIRKSSAWLILLNFYLIFNPATACYGLNLM